MNIALILAGGTGTRLGLDTPKQYIKINERVIISWCLETFSRHRKIAGIQIVADEIWRSFIEEEMRAHTAGVAFFEKFRGFSAPGDNRQLSVLHGLEDIRTYAEREDIVIIHDAARPLVTEKQISACMEAASVHDGALPVLPMKDTVYYSEDGVVVSSLLQRERIFAGQAPEAFRMGRYYEANISLLPDKIRGINGSTEPALLAGMDIAMIPGDEGNFKITTKADLERFQEIVERRAGRGELTGGNE